MLYSFSKRAFDIICSLVAIIVLFPLGLVIAIIIKISSPGPVFYTTRRAGKNYKEFTVYKFRSMHVYNSDAINVDKKAEGTYIANPDRIFKFGAFLRKSKLDELPQLFNILKSDMSIIGPRPVPIATAKRNYAGEYSCIMEVRPGLAGLDSLYDYAHGELVVKDIEEYRAKVVPVRTELARMYVEKKSIGLDVYCMCRTMVLIVQIVVLKKDKFDLTKLEKIAQEKVYCNQLCK